MNDFALCTDIEIVMELLDITTRDLAESIGVTPTTISRWRKNEEQVSSSNLSAFYNFAFGKGIRLNKIKEQLFKEDCSSNSTILFHGAKTYIEGQISIEKSKSIISILLVFCFLVLTDFFVIFHCLVFPHEAFFIFRFYL